MKNIIELTINEKGFETIQINHASFDLGPDLSYQLSQNITGKINISDFPVGISIRPLEEDAVGFLYTKKIPIIVKNLGNGKASLDIEACRRIDDTRYPHGVEFFQKQKVEYILTQRMVNPQISFFEKIDLTVHLHYIIEVPSESMENLIDDGIMFDSDVDFALHHSTKKDENDILEHLGLPIHQ
jgi:hypothetical protein